MKTIQKSLQLHLITLAVCLLAGGSALAQTMSKADFKMRDDKISADYKAAKSACSTMAGNAKDLCIVDAKGKEKIALAELEVANKPTMESHYKLRIAHAEAAYAMAREKCDDMAGNAKDVCVKEAKAAEVAAKADAKVQKANVDANATATAAMGKASDQKKQVREDAAADKDASQYQVEQEKCNVFSGDVKEKCVIDAKKRFPKANLVYSIERAL